MRKSETELLEHVFRHSRKKVVFFMEYLELV